MGKETAASALVGKTKRGKVFGEVAMPSGKKVSLVSGVVYKKALKAADKELNSHSAVERNGKTRNSTAA